MRGYIGIMWSVLFISLVMPVAHSYGKMVYVNDYIEITLRTGPSTGHKVIGMLPSGTPLELKETQELWSLVVPIDGPHKGKEGWVLSRYLTASRPRSLQIDELVKENEKLKNQIADYTRQIEELSNELSSIRQELNLTKNALQETKNNYQLLQTESTDFLNLKKKYEELKQKFSVVNVNYEKISQENAKLRQSQNIKWFLAGSGVFFGGWLIGILTGRRQRRRPSIYY